MPLGFGIEAAGWGDRGVGYCGAGNGGMVGEGEQESPPIVFAGGLPVGGTGEGGAAVR